ncbi:MAG: aminotransferase class I/II-fold pyridoxal phosphate-dependent enzyme [Calditrichaceae bacterium]|nr:aminotransferase class I/II-fold pyridoxal phosphate-dependent enzyme [Calditrichia bacterium]NUQ42556.1 aminotransferase class I/II-fold pyridoxal phosphate-dependent enzyme [Calditrichaceae bacterium]
MDIFDKCLEFTKVEDYKERGIYPYFFPISENYGPRVVMEGREIIMIGSNNYLGLTKDPRVQEAAIKAVEKFGTSCSGSRFLNGTYELHVELEARLAKFVNKEAALMFSTGYQTNVGAIYTILDKNSVVITDKTNHACLFDGILLAKGTNPGMVMRRYKHNDMDDLERVISTVDPELPKLIITDGVFSMEGDIVKLPRLLRIAKTHRARVYVDDAHGMGVLGKTGRGTLEHFHAFDDVDLVTTTFSKSFASLGGFVAGKAEVINYIKHFSRPLIFSAAIPPANTAAVLKALEIIESEPEIVHRLQQTGERMRREFTALGFDTGDSETPIIPILVRDYDKTFAFWKALFEAGIYTNAVVSPAVPADRSLLRTSYMATHTDKDLDQVLDTFKKIGKQMGII